MKRYLTLLLSLLFVLPRRSPAGRRCWNTRRAAGEPIPNSGTTTARRAPTSCASAGRLSAPRLRYPCPNAGNPMSPVMKHPDVPSAPTQGQDARQGVRPARAGSRSPMRRDCGNTCAARQTRCGKGPGITVRSRGGSPPRDGRRGSGSGRFASASSSHSTARAVPFAGCETPLQPSPRCRRTAWPMPGEGVSGGAYDAVAAGCVALKKALGAQRLGLLRPCADTRRRILRPQNERIGRPAIVPDGRGGL